MTMGKLRMFSKDWKIKYDKTGHGSWFDCRDSTMGIDDSEPHSISENFFHELIELILYNCTFRYIRNGAQDPIFVMSHTEMGELARQLCHILIENKLVTGNKIKKLIEEK